MSRRALAIEIKVLAMVGVYILILPITLIIFIALILLDWMFNKIPPSLSIDFMDQFFEDGYG